MTESKGKSPIVSKFNCRNPKFYILITIIVITVVLVFNLNNLNLKDDFIPKSIEIEIDGEMKNIDFSEVASNDIAYLLKYETWDRAEMNYDLATTRYLSDDESKVVGIFEDVDGFTYFELYSGFGLKNGNFYKAPLKIYENIESYVFDNYGSSNNTSGKVEEVVEELSEEFNFEMTENTVSNAEEIPKNTKFNYNQVFDFANNYGLSNGVIIESNQKETEIIIYNSEINSTDDLLAKRLKINKQNEVTEEKDVYLDEDLVGYKLGFKYGDSTQKKYLLAYRYVVNSSDKKLYSDLLVFTKEDISMDILQSYAMDYDEEKGIIPQGTIPAIIDFSLDIIGDYILYEDLDLFYKVQDVRTKEIYNSGENNPKLKEVEPCYGISGDNISIVKYSVDDSILTFNIKSKEFKKIELDNEQ